MQSDHSGGGQAIVLVGPAGAGKTTIAHRLIAAAPDRRCFSVSHTSRAMRANERHGVDYFFVSRDEFTLSVARGEMVEWAEVHGNLYGTSRAAIEAPWEAGMDVVFDVDIAGASALRTACGARAKLIFLTPPDWHELVRRLEARGSETAQSLARRLRTARQEVEGVLRQVDAGVPWAFVRNGEIVEAVAAAEAAVAAPPSPPSAADRAHVAAMARAAAADPRAA